MTSLAMRERDERDAVAFLAYDDARRSRPEG
jgi:hypothetical protein